MGIEYRLRVETSNKQALDGLLRQAPFFKNFDAQHGLYNCRHPSNADLTQMPDLDATIGSDGLSICDNGNKQLSEEVLLFLKVSLERMFGQVNIEEL